MLPAITMQIEAVDQLVLAVLDAVRREASAGKITADAAHAIRETILSLSAVRLTAGDTGDGGEDDLGCVVVQRAIAFIETHLEDPALSVATIAADSCVSPRHLQRVFAEREITVSSVIRQRRLERARAHLVGRHDVPISHIAHRWGFADLAHFSRLFKAAYGEAPSVYRRRHAS